MKQNGITLIALIITIIVLLILAGVALATLTGEGSIIQNAENAVAQYNNSVEKEQLALNSIEKYIESGKIDSVENNELSGITGKCTLLWEKEVATRTGYDEYEETTISINNLDKYKFLFVKIYFNGELQQAIANGIIGDQFEIQAGYIPVQILKNNNSRYCGVDILLSGTFIKYLDNTNVSIVFPNGVSVNMDGTAKIQLYGIE